MVGTLGAQRNHNVNFFRNGKVLSAVFMIIVIFASFIGAVLYAHYASGLIHVLFFPLFPILFLASLSLSLPLLMYVSYPEEFRHLHPLVPRDYMRLCKRTLQVLNNNGRMKISAKDL
jgi:hypothetical protein